MNTALTPREIQARIRAGEPVAEVAAAAGVEVEGIEGFVGPVLAEREFMASNALQSTIRRRGEQSHRRLGELVTERLQQRGLDADTIEWDAWRQEDLLWRVVGVLADDAGERRGEFVFDHKARFSVADNPDARWMIGEQLPDAGDEDENTIDFDDELALLRATKESKPEPQDAPGDDVPDADLMHDGHEDTSELDELYDMLSGISEDSVRIYTGLSDPDEADEPEDADEEPAGDVPVEDDERPEPAQEPAVDEPEPAVDAPATPADEPGPEPDEEPAPAAAHRDATVDEPVQDSLVEEPEPDPEAERPARKSRRRRGRAQVPSWDEIMFGGPGR
ncbi:septation protein SepH [uncultured Tessaracoccus sp.]|uniref:septation protein SepH n=1 Tax=uncultured Tessaracoccus sp. TaxID=905023 RepID=UPI0025D9725A|nr:septation protein SepH [uncultured Tessaracoccus sp.]